MRRKKVKEEIPKSVQKMKKEKEKREKLDKKGKRVKKDRKKLIKKIILILIIAIILVIGVFLAISANTWKKIATDMFQNKNSVVIDNEGNTIAEIGTAQKKLTVDIENMPQNLINAYVSIEDERFYKHHGVDIKRTIGAIGSYIIHFGNSSYGGSTITQQVVKNITGDNTDSITRKIKEWWKAYLLECYFTKQEILEIYLNIIYVGPNMYGVQTGAKYYFNKDVSNLSIAECAYLAGINNSPNSYNPFEETDNTEKIIKRTKTVLQKMLELGYINNDEYNNAINEVDTGLKFTKGEIETKNSIYSYHTDALISQVIEDLEEQKNISEEFATNYLYMGGLTIHSTQNTSIQEETEAEFQKKQYQLKSSDGTTTAQSAMVIIDHKTGNVLACVGGLGKKDTYRGLNRATQSKRQTGSAIKPLAVLVPGINDKKFTGATIYTDEQKPFKDNYEPKNNNDKYLGQITVRRALSSSQNIPFVEMMEQITPKKSIEYLEKMGISSLTDGDESLALALGGLEEGITPLEMAGAYSTIANDGKYIEPTFYTSITNYFGNDVIKAKQKTKNVFSKQVAYVIKELLTEPVVGIGGTAPYCAINGIDVSAKTGTTDENYDRWLCGFTPYYTGVTWFGYDQNETIYYNNQNPAGIIWANVMRNAHNGLESKRFEKPSWVTTYTICAETGMIAREGCTNKYQENFLWGTEPNECTKHSGNKVNVNNTTKNESTNKIYVDNQEDLELNADDNIIYENIIETNENEIEEENTIETENTTDENTVDNSISNNRVVNNTTTNNEANENKTNTTTNTSSNNTNTTSRNTVNGNTTNTTNSIRNETSRNQNTTNSSRDNSNGNNTSNE